MLAIKHVKYFAPIFMHITLILSIKTNTIIKYLIKIHYHHRQIDSLQKSLSLYHTVICILLDDMLYNKIHSVHQ